MWGDHNLTFEDDDADHGKRYRGDLGEI